MVYEIINIGNDASAGDGIEKFAQNARGIGSATNRLMDQDMLVRQDSLLLLVLWITKSMEMKIRDQKFKTAEILM